MVQANYRAALPYIRPLLRDPVHAVRRAALTAVLHWEDAAAAEQVRDLAFHDSNPYIRPAAVAGLAPLLGEAAVPDLQALVDDPNALVREAADTGLTRLGHAAAAGALPSRRAALVPADLPLDPAGLQAALEHWQRALAAHPGGAATAQVADLDSALTTLILALRNPGHGGQQTAG
jgi:HEAT repeat protein